MSQDYKNEIMKLKERIDGLRAGEVKPSEKRLAHAKEMAKYYNSVNAGEKGFSKRMNENATLVLAQQLEAVSAEIVLEPTEPLIAFTILSRASDVPPGADTYTYSTLSTEGEALPINNYADDVVMVTMDRDKVTHKLISYGAGFYYSIDDIERSVFFGIPLPTEGAMEARRAYERGADKVMSLGESAYGINAGLANQPVGSDNDQVRFTSGSSSSWTGAITTTNADVMFGDLAELIADHQKDSLGQFPPTHLLLPPGALARIEQAQMSNGPQTVATALKVSRPGLEFRGWAKLGNIDDNGDFNARALLLNNRSDVAQAIVAKEFTLLPPQPVNLAFKIVGSGKVGGVAIKKRIGLRYLTGLPTE